MRMGNMLKNKLKKLRIASMAPQESDKGRREALKTLGIYGAYTAPALVALLRSGKAVGASFLGE